MSMSVHRVLSTGAVSAVSRCFSHPKVASLRSFRQFHFSTINAVSSTTPLSKEEVITGDPFNNITDNIFSKIGVNLHLRSSHPLCIIKEAIHDYFNSLDGVQFKAFDEFYPIVSTRANFDELLIPQDHVSRSPNDTYYVDNNRVLRCHTSAHQSECLRMKESAFLVTGDVYRRDAIDATHYPVFHQTEGVRVFSEADWKPMNLEPTQFAEKDLKEVLEGLAKYLFGDVECRWVDEYFPFTDPSFELEIYFNGEWLEVLGCGVMQQKILDDNYGPGYKAWAFGLGLERLAMVLFDIPDIRLFWSTDQRFHRQFEEGNMTTKFKPFSKYPPVDRDIAFWLSPEYSENNFYEIIRGIAGDLCEEVKLLDSFTHPKTQRVSHCYRITYRSNERSLVDEEVNEIQSKIRDRTAETLKIDLR